VTDHAAGWFSSARSRAGAMTSLVMAEAKLAAMSAALMIFLAVAAAVCVLSAWGLALAGLAYGLIVWGLPVWSALLVLVVLLAIAAALLWRAAMKASRHLEFSATREQLGRLNAASSAQQAAREA